MFKKLSLALFVVLFVGAYCDDKKKPEVTTEKSEVETKRNFKDTTKNHVFTSFAKPKEAVKFEEFNFIHAADPQFGLIEEMATNHTDQNKWDIEEASLSKAIEQWNKLKPKFVVIGGDLVNAFPKKNEAAIRVNQTSDLINDLQKLDKDIPLILMPGNHDILDKPTRESVNAYKAMFGDDYYSFWVNNVAFIVLNSQYFMEPTADKMAYDEQFKWLNKQLDDAQSADMIIVLQHAPYFIGSIDSVNNETDWAHIPHDESVKILDILQDKHVKYVFSGHYHQNAEGTYKNITMIVTSAIGYQGDEKTHPGYRNVMVKADSLEYKYEDIEKKDDGNTKGSAGSTTTNTAVLLLSIAAMIFAILI